MFGRKRNPSLDALTESVKERYVYLHAKESATDKATRKEHNRAAKRASRESQALVSGLMARGVDIDLIREAIYRGMDEEPAASTSSERL